jgi:hypothetical protein
VHNNITIFQHHVLCFPSDEQSHLSIYDFAANHSSLVSIDESGGHLLSASIKLGDRHKPDLVTKAMVELDEFRRIMKGVVNLKEADRLSMDTRVK